MLPFALQIRFQPLHEIGYFGFSPITQEDLFSHLTRLQIHLLICTHALLHSKKTNRPAHTSQSGRGTSFSSRPRLLSSSDLMAEPQFSKSMSPQELSGYLKREGVEEEDLRKISGKK